MTEITAVPTRTRSASGVEHLADGRHLVPAPGHEAVDPVGGAEDGQQDGRRGLAVRAEEQPDEHRDAGQADQGDGVGDREDAVDPGVDVLGAVRSRRAVYEARRSSPGLTPVCYARPMPRFRPFAGLRYDRSVPLDKVIAPPYDVVGPEERAVLAARHRANAIHVELPVQDNRTGLDKYRSAAQIFATWRQDGVLVPEAVGRPSTRTG